MKRVLQILILLLSLGICIAALYVIVNTNICSISDTPSIEQLKSGLTDDYKFKNISLKEMAKRIYEYRMKHEYPKLKDKIINIYKVLGNRDMVPESSNVQDITLYKIATAKDDNEFMNHINFIHIYENNRYIDVVKAYDPQLNEFKDIDEQIPINTLILKHLLQLYSDESELRDNITRMFMSSFSQANNDQIDKFVTETVKMLLTSDEWLYRLITCNLESNSFQLM